MDQHSHEVLLDERFLNEALDARLQWYSTPMHWKIQNGVLEVKPDAQKDFWRKTYYDPQLLKDDGAILYLDGLTQPNLTLETSFSIEPFHQFDQAGLMLRINSENWIKTGIEVVDGKPKLSVVVTRDGWSDWSTQDWNSTSLKIRLHRVRYDSYVVEALDEKNNIWNFIRICHVKSPEKDGVKMGLFSCAPTQAGAVIKFSHLSLRTSSGFHHKA